MMRKIGSTDYNWRQQLGRPAQALTRANLKTAKKEASKGWRSSGDWLSF
jgi:hypothetical protein